MSEARTLTSVESDQLDLVIETILISFNISDIHSISSRRGNFLRALSNAGFIIAKEKDDA